ncbi:MAG: DinB family protein [Cyanobacteria bacterium]|nr:DinB family protein [Cyanobacteriota bacterium]
MNADQAKFLAGVIGQTLQSEWMHTYKAINAINDAKKDYKPAGDSRTAWDLAHHIAVCDVGFLQAVASNSFANFPAKTDAKNIPQLAEWYKKEMPKALEKVLTLDGNHLNQIVESWGMKLPSVTYLMFCNNHMIHHRGQLTTYIRPTGNKVPAMYGGSFDEKMGG